MAKVLIVDDDDSFRKAIKFALEKESFFVFDAPSGNSAKNIIKTTSDLDLIISDIQMPYLTGTELLEWLKGYRNVPLILMTGFSHVLESKTAYEKGAAGFLVKPFEHEELKNTVETVLRRKSIVQPEEKPSLDDQFCRVSIDDFLMGSQIPFNIFVRFSDEKYVKIAYRGENLKPDRIQSFKDKGVDYLYLNKTDFQSLVGYNIKIAAALSQSKKYSEENKRKFLKYTSDVLLEQLFVNECSKSDFQYASNFVNVSLSVISNDDNVFELIDLFNKHADFLYSHSLAVSLYTTIAARRLGWSSYKTFFKITMAGLLHDIGKKEISREVLVKPRHLLLAEEQSLLESHPFRGKAILESIGTVPDEIVQIVFQHHENDLGHGYPLGLLKIRIHPIARLIRIGDLLCRLIIKGPANEPMPPSDAIHHLHQFYGESTDPIILKAFTQIFHTK